MNNYILVTRILNDAETPCLVNQDAIAWVQPLKIDGNDCALIYMMAGPEFYVKDRYAEIVYKLTRQ